MQRLKQLEEENCRLKTMNDVRQSYVKQAIEKYRLSIRKACQLFRISRRVYYYRAQTRDDGEVQEALEKMTQRYPRYGYRKLYYVLRC